MEKIFYWEDPELAVLAIKGLVSASIGLFICLNVISIRWLLVCILWVNVLKHNESLVLMFNLISILISKSVVALAEKVKGKELLTIEVEGELPRNLKRIFDRIKAVAAYFINVNGTTTKSKSPD